MTPSVSWLLPTHLSLSDFLGGIVLMLFIYWGWDTAVSVNEETKDKGKTPGQAAIISTVLLLVTYVIVIFAAVSFAGIGTTGIGLSNEAHGGDVLSVLGGAIFGTGALGTTLSRLLILMVLSSAAASTQTTILPTARTTLSMAVYKALPDSFAKIHPKYLTPTVSTIVMGAVSIALYVPMNYISGGNVIYDAVTAIGIYIAFYYGLTALECVWYYRKSLTSSARNLWMRGIIPGLGWAIMWAAGIYSLQSDYTASVRLHPLDGARPALGDRRDLPHRDLLRHRRGGHIHLPADHQARVLPGEDPDPGHAHARSGPGRVAAAGGAQLERDGRPGAAAEPARDRVRAAAGSGATGLDRINRPARLSAAAPTLDR